MRQIIDVVNFNADASCLSCRDWMEILQGGHQSRLVRWLSLYLERVRKVVLGFPGATVADMAAHNPEAIDLINAHPEVFEVILRPFAHDVALLRRGEGFMENVRYGMRVLEKEFDRITPSFLPPEFMLTNDQVRQLQDAGIESTFVNPARFSQEVSERIPNVPYRVKGVFGSELNCIPFYGRLTQHYLHALQMYDCDGWQKELLSTDQQMVFFWRDGESSFLLPNGLEREAYWLNNDQEEVGYCHLNDIDLTYLSNDLLEYPYYQSYPVHSFTAWMKEFRMLGFVGRSQALEDNLKRFSSEQLHYWLMVISSDVLSAIEKNSPIVKMKKTTTSHSTEKLRLLRSERGFEGEEYLSILENSIAGLELPAYIVGTKTPHLVKWRSRINYLSQLN